jgi:hypothetical protein
MTTEAFYRLSLFSDHGARLIVELNGEGNGPVCGRFPVRGIVLVPFKSGGPRRVEVVMTRSMPPAAELRIFFGIWRNIRNGIRSLTPFQTASVRVQMSRASSQ